jgi:hypothetical protein
MKGSSVVKQSAILVVSILIASVANAGILGMLVNSRQGTSVTGKLVWACTYRVNNSMTTVTLDHICPPSMQFE